MPIAQINDIAIYYEVRGSGAPLLVIPGLAMDISELETLIRPLSNHYRVIALDNRGAGRSEKPDAPYSIELMAGDTAGLMDAIGVAHTDVLGISMGGRIALELALDYSRLVDRLILIGTSATPRTRMHMSWPMHLLATLRWLPGLRGKYSQPRYAFARQLEASLRFACAERLPQIDVPTLILHGRRDKTAPYGSARAMQAGVSRAQLETFRGGHLFFLMGEQRRVVDEITTFLG
jgi:pimeloyl-ACP methyl ester carboxylesterase